MKIQKIKNRSIIFTKNIPDGWDLNIHLIMGDKYNYIIDTGLGTLSVEYILDYIKHDSKQIIVINTHYHWDHVWGNTLLKDCVIISHKLCREMIDQNWESMLQNHSKYVEGEANKCLPNLVFENQLYFPDDKIRIFYTPGHTADSISVLDEKDKVLNVGDNIGDTMNEIIPNIYCEKTEYINTLIRYKELDFDTCVSGHNIVLGKEIIEEILKQI